jgi:hypothetical protein
LGTYASAIETRVRLNARLLARSRKGRGRVIVVGDSHAFVLKDQRDCFVLGFGPVTLHRLGRDGELATLLENRLRWNPAFRFRRVALNQRDVVLVSAGEIDVRCHLDTQIRIRGRYETDVLEALARGGSVACAQVWRRHGVRTGFLEIPPPARRVDSQEWPIRGALVDRVKWTGKLNRLLNDALRREGLPFVPLPAVITDTDGSLREELSDGSVHAHHDLGPAIREAASFLIRG